MIYVSMIEYCRISLHFKKGLQDTHQGFEILPNLLKRAGLVSCLFVIQQETPPVAMSGLLWTIQ